jgi:hypothetical protein
MRAERIRRAAVFANDDGGDSLTQRAERVGAAHQGAVGVAVCVDESRSERESAAIDDLIVGTWRECADVGDAVARDANARTSRGTSCAVEERDVRQQRRWRCAKGGRPTWRGKGEVD